MYKEETEVLQNSHFENIRKGEVNHCENAEAPEKMHKSRDRYKFFLLPATTTIFSKEVQIVYRLFLVNCYLLHVPRLPSQPAINMGGLLIH